MNKSELIQLLDSMPDDTIITIDDYTDDETAGAVKMISSVELSGDGDIQEYVVLR